MRRSTTRFPRSAGSQFPGCTSGDRRTMKDPSGPVRILALEKLDRPVLFGITWPSGLKAAMFHHKAGTA